MSTELELLEQIEKQRSTLLAKHAKELAELDERRDGLRRSQMDALKQQASALGYSVIIKTEKQSTRKSSGTRAPLTCRACRQVGLSGQGHTGRTHDRWLESQPQATQARFKEAS